MAGAAPAPGAAGRTAIIVVDPGSGPALCPFFGKCDGVILINGADGSSEFRRNEHKTADAICDLLLRLRPERVVCGYIGAAETQRLRAAGIDVRLGSCTCPIDELAACCCDLPKA